MDEVLVDERHLRRDFFFAPWFLRCCLIADACRASAAGLARSRRRILPTEDVGMLAARSHRVGGRPLPLGADRSQWHYVLHL